jgi:tetratricopeptide (TPR) repeat protein
MAVAILAGCTLALATGCADFSAQGRNAEGVRLFSQGRYHEALRQFQESTYTDPISADGYYNLAATYHRLGLVENRPSDLDQAENYYNQCLDRDPNHADCYRGLAVLLAEQGRNQEAFRLLEGWADRNPAAADAKIELARLFQEYGDRAAAKDHLIEALQADPDNPRALAALGKVREDMGESGQALVDYQRSLWYDRFQPQVASRIAALRSTGTTPLSGGPDGATRLVDKQSASLR